MMNLVKVTTSDVIAYAENAYEALADIVEYLRTANLDQDLTAEYTDSGVQVKVTVRPSSRITPVRKDAR